MMTDSTRAARLHKALAAIVNGHRLITSAQDAQHFFEAIKLQQSPSACLEKILANPAGLRAVRQSVRVRTSAEFICKEVIPFIAYLSHPDAKTICEGQLLQQVVSSVVEPPTAWSSILKLYVDDGFLNEETDVQTFAWLCLEVVTYPGSELAQATNDLTIALGKRPLLNHSSIKVREYGYQINKILQARSSSDATSHATWGDATPGGRHDNDFADFRKISIYPTTDELASTLRPFYRRAMEAAEVPLDMRAHVHLDNQFRLLREDMLAELRDDLRVTTGQKKGKRSTHILDDLWPVDIDTGDTQRGHICALLVSVGSGLEMLRNKNPKERKRHLTENTNILRHQAFGVLCWENEIIGFAFVVRDIDNLIKDPPVIGLQFPSSDTIGKVLQAFHRRRRPRFVLVDTPVFAYEPVLNRLKDITQLPLEMQILRLNNSDGQDSDVKFLPAKHLLAFIQKCREGCTGTKSLRVGGTVYNLDQAQVDALIYAFESPLSAIQGPPGTGKSFIGALAAKLLLEDPSTRILVLSYTNHALDQFLEDLLNIGIKADTMVRLGSKSTLITASLSFDAQLRKCEYRHTKEANMRLYNLRHELNELRDEINSVFKKIVGRVSGFDILENLEFSHDSKAQDFWRAFQVPRTDDGFIVTGTKRKQMKPDYLIEQWRNGKGPGVLTGHVPKRCAWVWSLSLDRRATYIDDWTKALRVEQLDALRGLVARFNETQIQVDTLFNEAKCSFIQTKQVIGCTTTAAAKYSSLITAAKPSCILVEEAGEILEAHILTALSTATKQLILIGDHKQLRPKCKNYALSVERGDGYDLNRSLFERLVLQGHRHAILRKQHRMDPEISQLVRAMTYPDLEDGENTLGRKRIRGVRGKVAFINHENPEGEYSEIGDRHDAGSKASKQNRFEADMVLKIVKYLGQQGYKTENIVILTPYLGQVRLFREMLSKDTDPLLSDLDSFELVRAGLLTSAAAKVNKGRIRLSTIDNYQGEERDIVIVSLTRSNSKGDIGFMKAPERLNVLLSRARDCLIMIGNMETFMASPQGQEIWGPFFKIMKEKEYLQDGLMVNCEQHPEHHFILSCPRDFDDKCPDGGCSELCNTKLNCGIHVCERRCHRLADHGKISCTQLIQKVCKKQHKYKIRCHEKNILCAKCSKEEEDIRRRAKRDLELEKARLVRQAAYFQELQEVQDEIAHHKRLLKSDQEAEEQKQTLEQQRANLISLKQTKARQDTMKKAEKAAQLATAQAGTSSSSTPETNKEGIISDIQPGSARDEWEYLKREEFSCSDALDTLMGMIGLEDVKRAFLAIKATIDTATRQQVSTKSERLGCTLLGNPGTGKTTVARLYAKFLTSMGVIAGSCFKETTGSKLASMGVGGCQKLIDEILDEGGGVVFIDEAYQLSSGNNPGGKAVLDFLLAEVENLNSKICFILAGYNKQMESFFAHNPGFPSRFPVEMKFEDYSDAELLEILELKVVAKYGGRMKAEGGLRGLYCRILTQRLGRGRGKEGFGNARAVENNLAAVYRRQSERLRRERRSGLKPNDLFLTMVDLIGPEPSGALLRSEAWDKLQKLIGLKSVKEAVNSLVTSIQANYQRELDEEPIIQYNLNRVFLGNPGTGKTTVAKLYGQILVDIGMLSNGEVMVKNPSDFVGSVIGQSEQQTKGILAASVGKVLVIDEAYGLYGGGASQGGGASDPYKTAVVDTIVAEVQSVPGEDRCVLLLGYRDQMEEMFQNVNPGLSRRFPSSSAFVFEDFDQAELANILDLKLKQQGFDITDTARSVAMDMLDRARNRPHFGNAGEVDIILNDAKSRHQQRVAAKTSRRISTLEALDFDEEFCRLDEAETNVAELFKDTVGCERLIATLQGYQQTVRTMKALGLDPRENISFNFLFRGPPGTGKTTTARKIGKVFYDVGFLNHAKVLDCSASDLIGQYIGQTGPKVRQLLDKALGGVLLIDEAYRLAEGHFAKEALDELVDACTKEKYHKRLVIIMAGYEDDINRLLGVNPGLTSRFPEVIDFYAFTSGECFELLKKKLLDRKLSLEKQGKGTMDMACLESPSADFYNKILGQFELLSKQPNWASARDVDTLAKALFQAAIQSMSGQADMAIDVKQVLVETEVEKMIRERGGRAKQSLPMAPGLTESLGRLQHQHQHQPVAPDQHSQWNTISAQEASHKKTQVEQAHQKVDYPPEDTAIGPPLEPAQAVQKIAARDTGVTDEVWNQLQNDAEAEVQREREYQAKLKAKTEVADAALRERIIKELIEEEERRTRETEARKKLEIQGRCPMGYNWIHQEGGWRCAGGSHFVSDGEIAE